MATKVSKSDVRHLVGKIFRSGFATDGDVRVDGKVLWAVLGISRDRRRGGPGRNKYRVRFKQSGDEKGTPDLSMSVPAFSHSEISDGLAERYTDRLVAGIQELAARQS